MFTKFELLREKKGTVLFLKQTFSHKLLKIYNVNEISKTHFTTWSKESRRTDVMDKFINLNKKLQFTFRKSVQFILNYFVCNVSTKTDNSSYRSLTPSKTSNHYLLLDLVIYNFFTESDQVISWKAAQSLDCFRNSYTAWQDNAEGTRCTGPCSTRQLPHDLPALPQPRILAWK